MWALKCLLVFSLVNVILTDPSAVDVVRDIYMSCVQNFSFSCVQPKALSWMNYVADKSIIRVTNDLVVIKNNHINQRQERSVGFEKILDRFDDFLNGHNLLIKLPSALTSEGPLTRFIPRSFLQSDPIQVPLSATGRSSKLVKKVIFPFLLGLKFNTAVLVPITLGLIALKTWKAFTFGLISLVLTGAVAVFSKFLKPPQYEVVHYPHIDTHHIDVITPQLVPQAVPVIAPSPVYTPLYKQKREALDIAYKGYQ
ncbi:hypothetical protein ABEB36_008906 [Hypothenemus hampei]|uniref:Osiris 18 n=1 Tax=Hypothenemus hampei TaxID=57062 RepID=A0ABD1ENJ8_HYPHA